MISIRVSQEKEKMIKDYSALKGKTVSDFLGEAIFEKIENEHDMKIYQQYLESRE